VRRYGNKWKLTAEWSIYKNTKKIYMNTWKGCPLSDYLQYSTLMVEGPIYLALERDLGPILVMEEVEEIFTTV
jgi:hypothetical protein